MVNRSALMPRLDRISPERMTVGPGCAIRSNPDGWIRMTSRGTIRADDPLRHGLVRP